MSELTFNASEARRKAEALKKSYLTGFMLAIVLTAVPFCLVMSHAFSLETCYWVIAVFALVQGFVHFVYFLHLGFQGALALETQALIFAGICVCAFILGSIWVMFDLYGRMM